MLYQFVFNSLYVSKAVEVGNNFVVHQADQVVAKKAKTLQDRIVISLNVVYNFIYIIKPLIIYLVAVFFYHCLAIIIFHGCYFYSSKITAFLFIT